MREVVLANKKTPVSTATSRSCQYIVRRAKMKLDDVPVEMANVPLRPNMGCSTIHPARSEPGIPIVLKITWFRYVTYSEPSPVSAPFCWRLWT